MAGDVVLVGEIPAEGVGALLRTLEERRVSGALRFEAQGAWHEVALLAGSLVEPASGSSDDDALESLLGAQGGRYEVVARLPPLPVSQGDARVRTGSLAVHVPADLMAWCERGGLTGRLTFLREGEQAEARYERGELVEIQLAGASEGELSAVFAWDEGTFRVEADVPDGADPGDASLGPPAPVADASDARSEVSPEAPGGRADAAQEPVPASTADADAMPAHRRGRARDEATVPIARAARRDDTGQRFLRVVETTLGAIVDQAEKQRAPSRSSPPLPMPTLRPPSVPPPPRAPREATVRIVYLTGEVAPLEDARPSSPGRSQARAAEPSRRAPESVAAPDSVVASVGGLVAAIASVAAFAALLLHVR
jgi:hypothetical protein